MNTAFQIKGNSISDGYHTFDELYDHRNLLFINLCLVTPSFCTWKESFRDYFLLFMETKNGQISYHIPKEYLHMIEGKIKKNQNYVWDEHTSDDVIERLKGK